MNDCIKFSRLELSQRQQDPESTESEEDQLDTTQFTPDQKAEILADKQFVVLKNDWHKYKVKLKRLNRLSFFF